MELKSDSIKGYILIFVKPYSEIEQDIKEFSETELMDFTMLLQYYEKLVHVTTENKNKIRHILKVIIANEIDIRQSPEYDLNDYIDAEDIQIDIILKGNKLNESSDNSKIDKHYKSKGYLNLNSFNRTNITEALAKKHRIYCSASTLRDFKGYIYTDKKDNSLVAIVAVATYENKESWIQPIRVYKKYRGYNLSKQLLDIAVKKLDAKYLAVCSDNTLAVKIYKKYGFKISKRVNYDGGIVYFMTIDSRQKINEADMSLRPTISLSLDDDGNMLLTKREHVNFETIYANSHELLKAYSEGNNIEGIKYELCKLWMCKTLIDNNILYNKGIRGKLVSSKEKKQAMTTKSFIMSDIKKYLKEINDKETNFNFQEYFNKTQFGVEIYKIDNRVIKASKLIFSAFK